MYETKPACILRDKPFKMTALLLMSPRQVQAEALQAELRSARADLHRAALELQERHTAAGRLAAKHAVLAARVRPSEEETDAEPRSQAWMLRFTVQR